MHKSNNHMNVEDHGVQLLPFYLEAHGSLFNCTVFFGKLILIKTSCKQNAYKWKLQNDDQNN